MQNIILDGRSLTIHDVVSVSRGNATVSLSKGSRARVEKARNYVEKKVAEGAAVYGITTGFGKFSDTFISADDVKQLQKNLIMSHACGMGKPLPTEVVRAVMLLRANALALGNSGIRLSTLETLIELLNKRVHPIIPEKGSLGASGDLAPLAHMALVMIGLGQAEFEGELVEGKTALARADIAPVELAEKEGLALINGTQVMAAIGCLATYDALVLAKTADVAAAMACEAQKGITAAYDEKLHAARPHKGQRDSARNLRKLLEGSHLALVTRPDKVQDAYSIRCAPQVHGACRDAISYTQGVLELEINSATDNPLIFPDEDEAISGGNFHGEPLALAMDFLGIALSELANISERRLERMINPQLSGGLPAFLTEHGGVNSGFMITQYSAASMVSENKVLAHPSSVDSIPSSANQEDHVSMGNAAARKAALILDNAQKVIGIELFAAAQALSLRGEDDMSPATRAVHRLIREHAPFIEKDTVMYPYMLALDKLVKQGEICAAAQTAVGGLE